MSKFVAFTPEQFHALDDKLTEINTYRLVAVNDATKQAMEQLLQQAGVNIHVVVKTPITIAEDNYWTQGNIRLCWVNGSQIEIAPTSFYVTLNPLGLVLYARGFSSTMSGILGYSKEWGDID